MKDVGPSCQWKGKVTSNKHTIDIIHTQKQQARLRYFPNAAQHNDQHYIYNCKILEKAPFPFVKPRA